MIEDLSGAHVLVTGGTKGLGLATALAFGRVGARCTLTYRWGSADEDEVRQRFHELGAPEPSIIQADAASEDDTRSLLAELRQRTDRIDVLVANVAGAPLMNSLDDYTAHGLQQSLRYSVWPLVGYLKEIRATFGHLPRSVVAMSSTGPDHFAPSYDLVAASKAMLETLCRYLHYRLRSEGVRVNVVRSRFVRTDSLDDAFGPELSALAARLGCERWAIDADEVASVVLALCSNLCSAVGGQVLTVDRGATFFDNVGWLYTERERLGL